MTSDAVELIDVSKMAADLGMTETEVRRALREAIEAGLLSVDAITDTAVVLRGLLPGDHDREVQP
jgi:hypothetical protein